MQSTRINARLSGPLAAYVEKMIGDDGYYETPSEYIRDLIRRDIERREGAWRDTNVERDAILAGYRDLAAGRIFRSSGDFATDMATLAEKEATGWK
jgi:antitoxin ParD1/3/4